MYRVLSGFNAFCVVYCMVIIGVAVCVWLQGAGVGKLGI
jgi:hypothetical protein